MLDCLGLGIAPADILLQIPAFPKPGAKIDAIDMTIQGGGPIPTAMVALSRLGMKAGLIAAVGQDIFGEFVINELKRERVQTELMAVKKQTTAVAVGWVEKGSGRRTIALDLQIHVSPRDIDIAKLPVCRAVHLDGRDMPACLKLARWARKKHISIIFDIGSMRNDVSEILPLVDHLVCAEDFALPFTGRRKPKEAIKSLQTICYGTILVTSGIRGSMGIENENEIIHQKAFIIPVVDTTGAGDVYHGAYIFGLLRGWDLRRRMEFASAAAAIKCTRPGGRSGIPNYNQVIDFLKKGHSIYA